MPPHITHRGPVVDDGKYHVVDITGIELAGTAYGKVFVIVEDEAPFMQVRMPEGAFVEVRQFDNDQLVIDFRLLGPHEQDVIQGCDNIGGRRDHQVHATDGFEQLFEGAGRCAARKAVRHKGSAAGGIRFNVDTEFSACLAAERTARDNHVLAPPSRFALVSRIISETRYCCSCTDSSILRYRTE